MRYPMISCSLRFAALAIWLTEPIASAPPERANQLTTKNITGSIRRLTVRRSSLRDLLLPSAFLR